VSGVRRSLVWIAGALGALAAIGLGVRERRAVSADLATTRDLHAVGYVGSTACRRCHEDHYRTWGRTFHRTMTTEATPAKVKGDFSGATVRYHGVTARMARGARGEFEITFSPDGGATKTVAVVRAVGSRRYQQYLAREGDALWRLPIAFNVEEKRWFPMTGAFLFSDDAPAPDDPARPVYGGGVFDRHVTRWNDNCVFCHNVGPNPGRDPETGAFATTVAELGIACEACHGPGREHVARNADPLRRYALHLGSRPDPTIVNPSRLSPARAADVCGRCHGQRLADDVGPFLRHGDPFVAGDDLALWSAPLWRDTALAGDREAFAARFWGDGTPRLTAYEYQGLLQSRCAVGGLTCTSCHGMHEGDPRGQLRAAFSTDAAASDRMCTGCHGALAGPAALAAHAHHDPAGAGARCVGCHMPRIVYGVLDVHLSHRIEIPAPARQARVGRPDACTLCHTTGSSAWAEAALGRWQGRPAGEVGDADAQPFVNARGGEPVMRAVAADALGRAPAFAPDERPRRAGVLLEVMAGDHYPAIRQLAWRGLRRLLGPNGAAGYDPNADAPDRARAVARLRAALGAAVARPPAVPRAVGADRDLEIGE
jgi:predicted CXXCH cytochrome family protein